MKVRSILLCTALVPFVACQNADGGSATGSDDETAAAAQGSDSVQVTDDESQVITMALDGSGSAGKLPASSGAELAAEASARLEASLSPSGCFTANQVGATATFTFNNCSGPHFVVHLTGTVVATYSLAGSTAHAHVTTTDFHVNSSTLSIDADATYTDDGGQKSLAITTDSSGTGPLGHTFSHEGSYVISWTDTCHTLDGTWSTTANGLTRTTTVSDLSRCEGFCPASGGTVTHSYRNGATLTLTYDGATLTWASKNRSGSIQLTCTPES